VPRLLLKLFDRPTATETQDLEPSPRINLKRFSTLIRMQARFFPSCLLITFLALAPISRGADADAAATERAVNRARSEAEQQALTDEIALVVSFARGAIPTGADDFSPRLPGLIEAAGEYCRDKGVEFSEALPRLWEVYAVLFCGQLPIRPGEIDQTWAVIYRDGGGHGAEIPLHLTLISLHPKEKGPKPRTPKERQAYQPNMKGFTPKGFSAGASIVWLESEDHGVRKRQQGEDPDLCVVVLEQGRPYAATDPWYHQTIAKIRVRATGFQMLWQQSAMLHAVNFVPTHEIIRYSVGRGRPQVILADPKEK
jgi:hypothetical protein